MSGIKIIGISVEKRPEIAPKVQEVLTGFGDQIMARFGVHDVGEYDTGLITLNFVGSQDKLNGIIGQLNRLEGVKAKYLEMD